MIDWDIERLALLPGAESTGVLLAIDCLKPTCR
jgi:hypothetical protein